MKLLPNACTLSKSADFDQPETELKELISSDLNANEKLDFVFSPTY